MFNNKITVVKGFQTSVNIAYDLHDENKIKNFIPTISAIEVFEDILYSISSPNSQRARLLVGAYGRGKSHIILVMLSLLSKKNSNLFSNLLNKVAEVNPNLHDFMLKYLNSDQKILPVVVSGNNSSLTQSFLNALQITLKNEELDDLMPSTNFSTAIKTIESWEERYIDTYAKFGKLLDESVHDFISRLNEYDVTAYEQFKQLHPLLTSGSEFNPFVGVDVIDLYEEVANKLSQKGYNGMYVIYDEFSKYLEASISTATISDTKLLQDLAEKCNRSGEKQMHLMLISHKDISNYIDDSLPKEKVDGWRGVSGRFLHMELHNNFSQMYEIISQVINKDTKFWSNFQIKYNDNLLNLENKFVHSRLLDTNIAPLAVRGCYPLHPTTTFILPRLSEKVAQNERTLFTFLSAEQKNTLNSFLSNDNTIDFPLVTPDYLYDYFEPLFKKEHYSSEIHKLYKLTSKVSLKIESNLLGTKILKSIALLYIIEQFEKLPPTYESIVNIFCDNTYSIDEVKDTLDELIKGECIIYLKQSNGYLKIKETSGVDIHKETYEIIEKNKATLSVRNILNQANHSSYFYPVAYNDEMEITRYFHFQFIDSDEVLETTNWNKKLELHGATGCIFAIIPKNSDELELIRTELTSNKHCHQRVLFILPKTFQSIADVCYQLFAVQQIKEQATEDSILIDECELFIDDLEEVIRSFILSYCKPENKSSDYYYNGAKENIRRKTHLSSKLSDICYSIYTHTPVINNESINKNVLPGVAIKSRNKVVAALLESELLPNLGLTGSGQEVSFMRSTLIQTGILKNVKSMPTLDLRSCNPQIAKMLEVISSFISSATNTGLNMKELYDKLILPEYGYGIKKGVIPIYLAVIITSMRDYVIIKSNRDEHKITVDLLNSINETPERYIICIENWNDDKAKYIEELSLIFKDYIIQKEIKHNSFDYITAAMERWYINLPRYTKELKEIYSGKNTPQKKNNKIAAHMKFLTTLKQCNVNPNNFIFNKVPSIYGYSEFNTEIVNDIRDAKAIFDNAKQKLVLGLIDDIKHIFSNNNSATLSSIMKDWHEQLGHHTVSFIFANNENKVLQAMERITNDEGLFIEKIAKIITGLRIDDWNTKTIEEFLDYLLTMKKNVLEYNNSSFATDNSSSDIYTISFVNNQGERNERTFEKIEYTPRAKLLLNTILNDIDEMGQSISEQEKRQVLMEILEKMF